MAMPSYSANNNPHDSSDRLNSLLTIIDEQLIALIKLKKTMSHIRIHLSNASLTSLYNDINLFTKQQNERFNDIDELINENILSIKKGITKNNYVFSYGKEVRKVETNIQKVKLMICNVVNMLLPSMEVTNTMLEQLQSAEELFQNTQKDIKNNQIKIQQCKLKNRLDKSY